MKKIIKVSALVLILFLNVSAQHGSITVKRWADDKKAAFSFSFDDGYISHYQTVRPILNNYGFKGTFYLISGALTETLPGNWRYGTWEQFRTMFNEGHEMGSHTVTHPDLTAIPAGSITSPGTIHYELYRSKIKIEEKIPGINIMTLAYPYIAHSPQVDNLTDLYYEGAREGGNSLNNSSLNNYERLGIHSRKFEFNLPRNSINDDLDELNEFKNYINNAIADGKWGSLMIHEVYPFNEIGWAVQQGAYYPMSGEWLTDACEFLKEKSETNDIWVETLGNILKYIRERDAFYSTVVSESDSVIEIEVTDELEDRLYDFPLTVDIIVPSDWDTVVVFQNGQSTEVSAYLSGAGNLIRASITPDKGNVILKKKKTENIPDLFAVTGNIIYADSSTALQNVKILLTTSYDMDSTMTNNNGSFSFDNLQAGLYNLSFSKTEGLQAVNASDALLALLNFTGTIDFDAFQSAAGDVNNDGKINASDALLILYRFSGLIDSFNKPDWIFFPPQIETQITDTNLYFNINAIITGDLNKSYRP